MPRLLQTSSSEPALEPDPERLVTVNEDVFRWTFRHVFENCKNANIDEIYAALQRTDPPFDDAAAIRILQADEERKLRRDANLAARSHSKARPKLSTSNSLTVGECSVVPRLALVGAKDHGLMDLTEKTSKQADWESEPPSASNIPVENFYGAAPIEVTPLRSSHRDQKVEIPEGSTNSNLRKQSRNHNNDVSQECIVIDDNGEGEGDTRNVAVAVEIPGRRAKQSEGKQIKSTREEIEPEQTELLHPKIGGTRQRLRGKRREDICSDAIHVQHETPHQKNEAKRPKIGTKPSSYTPNPSWIEEDQLVIDGEEIEGHSGEEHDSEEQSRTAVNKHFPCRTLDEYFIYDAGSKHPVPLSEIGSSHTNSDIRATGYVGPLTKSTSEISSGEAVSPHMLYLSSICEWETDDTHIWLRTQFASYKLLQPHQDYTEFITPIHIRIKLSRWFIYAMGRFPRMRLAEFYVKFLPEGPTGAPSLRSGFPTRQLNQQDVQREAPYILSEVEAWIADELVSATSENTRRILLIEQVLNSTLHSELNDLAELNKSKDGSTRHIGGKKRSRMPGSTTKPNSHRSMSMSSSSNTKPTTWVFGRKNGRMQRQTGETTSVPVSLPLAEVEIEREEYTGRWRAEKAKKGATKDNNSTNITSTTSAGGSAAVAESSYALNMRKKQEATSIQVEIID